jgi:hypothetical protein
MEGAAMDAKRSSTFTWIVVVVLGLLFLLSLAWLLYGNYQAGDSAPWQLISSGILLSVPLALLYGALGVLIVAASQRAGQGQINRRLAKLIYWTPRIAGILIILFVSLFALDVFSEGYTAREAVIAFFIHMLPSIGLAIALALGWRWEWIGFLTFLGMAAYFMRHMRGDIGDAAGIFLLFVGPMLLIALLFGVNWLWRKELHLA